MENEAILTYTTESKGFEYKDGDYNLTGSKVINGDKPYSVEGGIVRKTDAFIGTFYMRIEADEPRISLNNVPYDESKKVMELVRALLEALAE